MALVKWVDLSSVGVHLGSYREASGEAGIALIDGEGKHHEAIIGLGFQPANGVMQKGLYIRPDHSITPGALRSAFGSDAVKFFADDAAAINRRFSARVKEITRINSQALFLQQRPIGMNHLGEIVQESVAGRFVLRKVGEESVVLREDGGGDSALFLRAKTREQLRRVAKGFVKRIMVRKENLRREHVARLIEVSNFGNFSRRDYQEAIEVGLNELFAEGLATIFDGEDVAPLAAFDLANSIYLGMPELKERTANSVANQQYSTTLPLAALMQAMVGSRAELARSAVLDPTIGNANLVSMLNVGVPEAERCSVYGVELDPARVEMAQDAATQVLLGDATTANFRALFNQPEGFDYILANPPFGSMDSKVETPLPLGSAADTMTIQRLDHLILLRALHARADLGRAVFITGADSAIEDGEVKGRSKSLLNYLYDHYNVEGVVDISGELYKKQGAQFPLRMYVVGTRKAEPREEAVPERLNVIRTYEGLREWAEEVIAKQVEIALDIRELADAVEIGQEDEISHIVDDEAAIDDVVQINYDDVQAVVVTSSPVPDVPEGWLLMNAPRPLLGQLVVEDGEYQHGRFYAAIDLTAGALSERYFERNVRDDGYVVYETTPEQRDAMALQLVPEKHRAAYHAMDASDRVRVLHTYVGRLSGMTFGELQALKAQAEQVVESKVEPVVDAKQAFLAALIDIGWENQGGDGKLYWVTKTIGGGRKGVVNPHGDRRLSARLEDGRMLARHGDGALIDLAYDDTRSAAENAEVLDIAVDAIDPRLGEPEVQVVAAEPAAEPVAEPAIVDAEEPAEDEGDSPAAARDGYSAYDEGLLKMPTAVQLGLNKLNGLVLFENNVGWSNGSMLDLAGRPRIVTDAIKKYFVDETSDSIRHFTETALQRVAEQGEQNRLKVVPAALYDVTIENEGKITGSGLDIRREKATSVDVRAVVLVNEEEREAVMVDRKYFSYFVKQYGDVEFISRLGNQRGPHAVAVKRGDELVGLMMPLRTEDMLFERAMEVANPVEPARAAEAPKVVVRDATMKETAAAKKAEPMINIHGEGTGWRQLPHANSNGVTLVSADGLKAVEFVSANEKSGTAALRAFAVAQGFAMDNPYRPEIVEGPRGELVVQPIMQGGEASGKRKGAAARPKFTAPPTDKYVLEKSSLNSVKLRPLPGKSFSEQESSELVAWFLENGWSASMERNFVKAIGGVDARWSDVPQAARLTKAAMKKVEQEEKADAARTQAAAERADTLERLDSADWIDKVFGPDVMNDFNKAALAKYLDGEVESFDGLTNHNWSSGFAAVGIDDEQQKSLSVQDALAAVKSAYVRESTPAPETEKVDTRQDNDYQQRYIAYSNVSEPDTMIPANLSGPIYDALASIKAAHGDIDEFVATELRIPVSELGKYYKAEQVDAMAMIFHATNRGLGFLLGDKMGVGKGRVLAGVARRERLNGRIPVFITVTPNLFSDFLERDVAVTGSRELFKSPLIINDECKTVDEHGQVVVRSLKRPEYKRFAEKGELPEGTDMVLLTYSQISRLPEHNLTSRFLRTLSSKYPLSFLLDESHNGAGASNTSSNLEQMIDAVGRRGSVVYSSGTAIKSAKNLRVYKKILPRGIDHEELLAVVESDPLSLQEALNWEIASQGCMISRELDNAGIEKQYVMSEAVERNRAVADSVARIFSAMCYLSGDVAKVVGKMNKEIRKELENVPEADREGNRMGATSLNFGSRLHELNRQLLLAIKAPDIVKRAIAALEQNVKPIISLQHTGESMLVDFVTRANEVYGAAEESAKLVQKVSVIDNPVTFKDLLAKYLEKISWVKVQGRYGDVSYELVQGERFEVAIGRIQSMIDELDDNLPLTPIDYIREGMAAKGYTVAEISGRNLMARTLEDGRVSIEPVPGRMDKTRVNRAVRDFNNGECDVLILTGSGSTGLSVQASPAVGHDVRPRRMIKAEMQPDIARERQMDGRHNRTGQIVLPEYEIPLCGLPADDRLAMMFNNKNRSLSSSTVANRDSKDLIKQVPDLLNEVGDMAAEDLLYEQPALVRALDIDLPEEGDTRLLKSGLWYCNKLSGRLSLLSVEEQEQVYADWQAKFVEKLDMLKAEGRNPLEVAVLNWNAQVVGREIFMGTVAKNDGSKSSFNAPIYLTTLSYEKTLKAVRAVEIDRKIANMNATGLSLKDNTIPTIIGYLTRHREELLEKHRSKKFETVEIALAAKEPNEVQGVAKKLEWMVANLPNLAPGAIFADKDLEGKMVPHVVVAYGTPSKIDGYSRPSDYTLYTMQPGSDVVELTTLSTLYSRGVELMGKTFAQHDLVRSAFDQAENGVVTKQARVFDGNLFEATALNLRERVGSKIVYTDHTGARQHGILIYSDITTKKLEALPEKVRDVEVLVALLNSNTPVTSDSGGDVAEPGFGMVISRTRLGTYSVSVPSSKLRGGDIFLDPVLSLIAGKEKENKYCLNFSTNAGKMTASVKNHQISDFLSYLIQEKNLNFYLKDRAAVRRVRSSLENVNEQRVGGGE